jgi:general secretion pathway protein K
MFENMPNNKDSGAALIAVLMIAVVMVVLMSTVSRLMDSRLQMAESSKQLYLGHAEVYAKISELTYLLATQRLTAAGISQGTNPLGTKTDEDGYWVFPIVGDELRADGEPVIDTSGLRYSIQNESGLIPFNTTSQYWLKRWFQKQGFSVAEQAKYVDTLADYLDPDDWRRPAGAEKTEYKEGVFTQPANFLLQNCSELWKVFSWAKLIEQHPELLTLCNLSRSDSLNINAIPIALWKIYWPNSLEKVVSQRQQGKWLRYREGILDTEPALLNEVEDYYSPLGGSQFQLEVTSQKYISRLRVERGRGLRPPFTIRASEKHGVLLQ